MKRTSEHKKIFAAIFLAANHANMKSLWRGLRADTAHFRVLSGFFGRKNVRLSEYFRTKRFEVVNKRSVYGTDIKENPDEYSSGFGAGNRTWTCMKLLSLEPESSASANSAIPASGTNIIIHFADRFVKCLSASFLLFLVGLSIILDTIGRKNFFRRKPLQRTHRPVVGATLVGS